jgi:hypothetical protein
METIARIYEVLPKTVANLTDRVDWLLKAQNGQDPDIPTLDVHQYATLKRFDPPSCLATLAYYGGQVSFFMN